MHKRQIYNSGSTTQPAKQVLHLTWDGYLVQVVHAVIAELHNTQTFPNSYNPDGHWQNGGEIVVFNINPGKHWVQIGPVMQSTQNVMDVHKIHTLLTKFINWFITNI